jgi:hypothetical protein
VAAGRVASLSDSSAVLVPGRVVRLSEQRRLAVRLLRSDAVWNGALIGAVATAPVALWLAGVASGIGEQPFTEGDRVRAAVGGALSGALIGVMIDAARGNRAEWRVRWRAGGT